MVLGRAWSLIDGSKPFAAELDSLYEEAERVARDLGDPVQLAEALHFAGFGAACRGDRAAADEQIDESMRLYESMRRPRFNWVASLQKQALAEHHGELAAAEQAVGEAVEYGRAADISENVLLTTLGGCLYQIRRAQGRLDEMVDLLTGVVERTPDIPLFRVVLAGAYVETDRIEEGAAALHVARRQQARQRAARHGIPGDVVRAGPTLVRRPAARGTRGVPVRTARTVRGTLQLERAAGHRRQRSRTRDARVVASTSRRRRPSFRGRSRTGRAGGCRAFVARCHYLWARVLADRGEAARARERLEIVIPLAERLDLTGPFGIVPRGRALLDRLN